jgi:hypothetical protein
LAASAQAVTLGDDIAAGLYSAGCCCASDSAASVCPGVHNLCTSLSDSPEKSPCGFGSADVAGLELFGDSGDGVADWPGARREFFDTFYAPAAE